MKIAVVGAGLAGLSAAWLLERAQHQVTLFERQPRPGFTAASVAVPGALPGGLTGGTSTERVDVPLRVFYPGYYPTLTRLYQALDVPSEPVSYASSLTDQHGALYFRYRNLRWGTRSIGMLAPQDFFLGIRALRILAGLLRFRVAAVAALKRGELAGQTIAQHVAAQHYPADFVDGFLLPAIATVCTCNHAQARQFPAAVIVDYLARGLASQPVHRALHGADDVERRLLAGIADLRCNTHISGITRCQGGVALTLADGPAQHFDHLVLATQANQALALLHDASAEETAALAGFAYTPVPVITHTDARLMPTRRRDWSPVNLRLAPGFDGPESTIWVNAVQPALRGAADVFQTVHPQREPQPGRVIARAMFERPVVDARSVAALLQLDHLQAQPGRRLWFCGSYAQAGIPLLESAAHSAYAVVDALAGSVKPALA